MSAGTVNAELRQLERLHLSRDEGACLERVV
jgi:hypothetical protein